MPTENRPDATLGLDALIEQLRNLVQNSSSKIFGSAVLDEEEFYVCTSQIRKSAPRLFADQHSQSYNLLEQIEGHIEAGSGRVFGKVVVKSTPYLTSVEALREAIAIERQVVEISSPQTQADEIIRIAQMQAQSIIEQAHQEAQRIIDDAKNQSK